PRGPHRAPCPAGAGRAYRTYPRLYGRPRRRQRAGPAALRALGQDRIAPPAMLDRAGRGLKCDTLPGARYTRPITKASPTLTVEQLMSAVREKGWRILEGERGAIAERGRGVVQVRLRFGSSDSLKPYLVRKWAERFGMTPDDFS